MPVVKSGHYFKGCVAQCQRAKDGWLCKETCIKWPGQLQTDGWHSEYDYFMTVPFFSACLASTNGSLPSILDHFTEYEHWQYIGVLLGM